MPCSRIIFQACAARFKCFWLCLVLAQLYDPHRPLMQRKTNSQTNGDPGAFLKEVLLLSNVEHVTASIGSMQCAWACIKYRNAISYWSEVRHHYGMHDMYTSARPFLCENWCHPALLDPSAWFLLGSHAQRYEFLVMRLNWLYTSTLEHDAVNASIIARAIWKWKATICKFVSHSKIFLQAGLILHRLNY